jgi:hypothetical protein
MATLVVQLLRARDDVFFDVDSIPAGERWLDALLRAIDNATHFYLLWCTHSAGSKEVEREWQRAISGNKRLVPVLLDATPLAKPLTEYEWVDFRGVVQGHQAAMPGQPPPRGQRTFATQSKWKVVLAALVIIVTVGALLDVSLLDPPPGIAPAPSIWPVALVILSVVAVVTLAVLMTRSYQRRRRSRRATEQLAEAIAQDLATRGGGS